MTGPRQEESTRPGGRTTYVLVAVVVVLAMVGIGEIVYLNRDPSPTVSAAAPIVTGEVSHRAAVEAAATATEQILSTTYQDYDGQVDNATERMTDTFAKEYRATSEDIKDRFVAQQTKLKVKAVAQGVVQASPDPGAGAALPRPVRREGPGRPAAGGLRPATERWSRSSAPTRAGWCPTSRPSRVRKTRTGYS